LLAVVKRQLRGQQEGQGQAGAPALQEVLTPFDTTLTPPGLQHLATTGKA
jgi:hypothetical protein